MNGNAENLKQLILSEGCAQVGFAYVGGVMKTTLAGGYPGAEKLQYAVSLVYKLSDAVIDGITDAPTHTYFHHYRTVNAALDRIMLKAGGFIESCGYSYIPVAASQSIDKFEGLFQHKTAARLAGLGNVGKSGLFISRRLGARVRLGTILTDMPLPAAQPETEDFCGGCRVCISLCPAMAICEREKGSESYSAQIDKNACSQYMKTQFQHIGRGAVCGICMKNCAYKCEK